MSNYIEQNLIKNETLVKKAALSPIPLVISMIKLILEIVIVIAIFQPVKRLFDFAGLSIVDILPHLTYFQITIFVGAIIIFVLTVVHEIKRFFRFFNMELAFTNKRVIGKLGVINTSSMDAPLDKIHSVTVSRGLFGRLFDYGTVVISVSTFEAFRYDFIRSPDEYKTLLLGEIDRYNSNEEANKESEEKTSEPV